MPLQDARGALSTSRLTRSVTVPVRVLSLAVGLVAVRVLIEWRRLKTALGRR